MKKHLLYIVLLLACCGCAKDIVEENGNTVTFYGSVIDFETGNPVPNAFVVLYYGVAPTSLGPSVASAYTGTDGAFSFTDVEKRNDTGFVLSVECAGYQKAWQVLSANSGNKAETQIIIKKSKR